MISFKPGNISIRFFLLFILAMAADVSKAQQAFSISGFVSDQSDKTPIAGAQIFLNGSTIGTTTNPEGNFTLKGIPEGVYELVVSFLGYENITLSLNTNQLATFYRFELIPTTYQMDEIVVRPDPEKWKQDFQIFEEVFIGEGPYSSRTKIKNPEVLNFYFDPDERVFTAKATDRLVIENKALGYTIYYLLDYFVINYAAKTNSFGGRPFFEPMQSKRKRINSRWEQNREQAYYGSFQHFTNSLIAGIHQQEGFEVRFEVHKEGKRYLYDGLVSRNDFFTKVDSSTYSMKFDDFLNVTYTREFEDLTYLQSIASPFEKNPRMLAEPQNSLAVLTQDSVLIDKSGYYYNPTALLWGGYWGFEKISDQVPLDYKPPKK